MRNRYGVAKIIRHSYSTSVIGWNQIRDQVLHRDRYKCQKCNKNLRNTSYREVHHIIPLTRGGRTVMSNLILLCKDCHTREHPHLLKFRKRK